MATGTLPHTFDGAPSARWWQQPLPWLLLLAASLRLPLAFWPNLHAPDEIYQTIEPAWRMLGHDAFVSWEWRYGIRGWTLPTLISAPVALGNWLVPGGTGLFVAPRIMVALASLAIVASAFVLGARLSRMHGIVAGGVAAIWFELVYFAPHTLGEPLATAMILPAAVLLTSPAPTARALAAGGALLALALVCRFQYAPAIGVLVLSACWRQWGRLPPMMLGGAVMLALCGLIDALNGAMPYAWLIGNVTHNLMHGRADSFGTSPALEYLGNFIKLWSLALMPMMLAIWFGARHLPLLLAMALADLVFHSLIGHKEHRFIFLSVALLVILAALGSADWVKALQRQPAWRRWALPLVAGGWIATSILLASTGVMPDHWRRGTGAMELARALRTDPATCGVALYEVPYFMLPGRENLAGRVPVYAFDARDPQAGEGGVHKAAPSFNRLLARRDMAAQLPASFVQRQCAVFYDTPVCIYTRSESCDAQPGRSFLLNDVLVRLDL